MQADSILVGAALHAFTPPPILTPSQFAEAQLYLPASSNSRPGPLRLTQYQRGMIDTFVDPKVHTIVMCCSAQVGKSLTVDALVAYTIACAPGPILHVSPTNARAEEWVRDRFDPLVKASPALRAAIGGGRRGGGDSLTHKQFVGGSLNLASSFQPSSLAARSTRYLFLDEVDRFAPTTSEGDPVPLAIKRTRTFDNRKIVLVSTPTSRVGSRISQWFAKGDQRRWHLPCPECGHFAAPTIDSVIWKPGEPNGAMLVCDECGHHADEAQRRVMIDRGKWRATATGEPGAVSFHLSEIVSPFSSLESVARQFEAADTPEKRRVVYNTVLGETYDAGTEVDLDASTLQARAETIQSPFAANIVGVTCGCDIQGNRIEATFLAHHADQKFSVLNHVVLMGDTSAGAVWGDLDAALGTTFTLADGRVLPIAATAIDSGFSTESVINFVLSQRRNSRRTFAIKGVSGFDRPVLKEGAKVRGSMRLLLVGVDGLKLTVAKRLGLEGGSRLHPTAGPSRLRLLRTTRVRRVAREGSARLRAPRVLQDRPTQRSSRRLGLRHGARIVAEPLHQHSVVARRARCAETIRGRSGRSTECPSQRGERRPLWPNRPCELQAIRMTQLQRTGFESRQSWNRRRD